MSLSRERTRLLTRLRTRRTREREGLFLVEGIRAVNDALSAGARPRFALVSPRLADLAGGAALRERLAASRIDTVELDDAELAVFADTEAPQGVLVVCPEPEDDAPLPLGPLLVLDGIQDPGNVGTLVRVAAAFGLRAVVLLDGCADPYGTKAARAAAGALFATRIVRAPWSGVEGALRARGPLYLADMGGCDVADVTPRGDWSLVVGSEGAGARAEVRAVAQEVVSVPMPGGHESLNVAVAGAILLYALVRGGPRV